MMRIKCLTNLPEVVKGALFSRYSRSTLSIDDLIAKEFSQNGEEKAQDFYDRILDGYGDDSIGELGGAHLSIEGVSMLAAKAIEDCRIGGSPLEKSTRYVRFDQRVDGKFAYYREPEIMASRWGAYYEAVCDMLFEIYGELIPEVSAIFRDLFPQEAGQQDPAYKTMIRTKTLDALRGLLPAATLTNLGLYGNGRFFEGLLQKLHGSPLAEQRIIGGAAYGELAKIIPSFVRRGAVENQHGREMRIYEAALKQELASLAGSIRKADFVSQDAYVSLLHSDVDEEELAYTLLFSHRTEGDMPRLKRVGTLDAEEVFLATTKHRKNRRHKSPRALERVHFDFEIMADFGTYRDLQRHRMLTQERQIFTADHSFYMPDELRGTKAGMKYVGALEEAKTLYEQIVTEMPQEAQYVVPMAYNIRWYFHINLRALQWLCELRSGEAGHPTYRRIAQNMALQVINKHPMLECFFGFVNWSENTTGRLKAAQKTPQEKLAQELADMGQEIESGVWGTPEWCFRKAVEHFGDDVKARLWWDVRNPYLGWKKPNELDPMYLAERMEAEEWKNLES